MIMDGGQLLRVIVGAGGTTQDGWLSLDQADLDITDAGQWARLFEPNSIDAIVAEHVFEHLTPGESFEAARNFYIYLKPGAQARICVPDGFHPDWKYVEFVSPVIGFTPDHKQLFDYRSLAGLLWSVGFIVRPLEYWDERGALHSSIWSDAGGRVKRCSRGLYSFLLSCLVGADYTSLLVDAVKPNGYLLN